MKKKKGIVLGCMITAMAICLCGCSLSKKSSAKAKDSEIVTVGEDNSVVVTYTDDFDEEYYDKDELEKLVDSEIKEFNETYALDKTKGITKESLNVKSKKATLKLKFSCYQDYETYCKNYVSSTRNTKLFIGTYEEAVAAGYNFSGKCTKTEDSSEMTVEDIQNEKGVGVFYTNEGTTIKFPGEIISIGQNVTVKDGLAKTTDKRENYIIYKLP